MRNQANEELVNHFLLKTYTPEQVKDMDVVFEDVNDDPNSVATIYTDTNTLNCLKPLIEKLNLNKDFVVISYHTYFGDCKHDLKDMILGFHIKTIAAKNELVQSLRKIYNDDKNVEEKRNSARFKP